eukprot:10455257-Prorocentrum_lima.AAC.1
MTSSLVGSEMCIRDRRMREAMGAQTPQQRLRRKAQNMTAMVQVGSTSVSYTHLTLPTICSV